MNNKGFFLLEIAIALLFVFIALAVVVGASNVLVNTTKTKEKVKERFHITSILEDAKTYCKQNGVERGNYTITFDGKNYTVNDTCQKLSNNLYLVSVNVCDEEGRCENAEGYVSK